MDYRTQIYEFCTIFDSSYYTKGLALYNSLSKVCNFHLYIFTPDEKCLNLLVNQGLSNVTLIRLSEIEDTELIKLKSQRDIGEYFWTIKASCIKHLFEKYDCSLVSYVDADTFFYSSPEPIFDELGDNSVLIVPHNFSPRYKKEIKNGIYNAGFISFRNDDNGLNALTWWNSRCREWCYRKKEEGKFGDQMYLNQLSEFPGVHSLKLPGVLANWNIQQYKFEESDGKITGLTHDGIRFGVIFFHFHYLKFLNSGEVELGRKYISSNAYSIFYHPYIKYLLKLAPFELQGAVRKPFNWKTPIIFIKRKLERSYNIFPVDRFVANSNTGGK